MAIYSRPAMADVDDTLHGETIAAESLAPENRTDFDDLLEVPREHYEIGAEIARGGMGRVVAARDRRTGRPIVIKEVRSDLIAEASRDALIRRFKREAMLTARLQHPAVVPVYEIGRFGDVPFIAMKRVDGTPLLDLLIEAESLAERMALLPSVIAVAEAIAYAHSESVIHRDLKPANILVGAFGETVVIDWGLAKLLSESDELIDSLPPVPGDVETVAGAVFGTPSYMPPEQAHGEEVDAAADVYAIGALLYHLLTGEAPYSEVEPHALIDAVRSRPPRPVTDRCPDAPADLVSVVDKAMARIAGHRYTAPELVGELRRFQSGRQVAAHDYTVRELLGRWVSRHRALVITAAVLVLAGAAATGWFVIETMNARDRALAEEKRATERHVDAMRRTFERGLGELEDGNRREALAAIAEAYPHLDDPRVPRALAEALRGVRGFAGELAHFDTPIDAVAIRADGARVAAYTENRVRLLTASGDQLAEIDGITPAFVGDRLVTIAEPDKLEVWSSDTGEKLGEHALPGVYHSLAHGGDAVFVRTNSGAIALSVDPPSELFTLPHEFMLDGLGVTADGERFSVIKMVTRVYDRTGAELLRVPGGHPIAIGAIAPDGSELARTERGGLVRYSGSDGSVLGTIRAQAPHRIRYSTDGERVLFTNGMVRVCIATIGENPRPRCVFEDSDMVVAPSADLSTLAIARLNGDVAIRDGASGRVRQLIAASRVSRPEIALTESGERLVTGDEDGAVRLWKVGGESFDATIEYRGRRALHTGQLVLLASDGALEIWDPDRPEGAARVLEAEGARPRPAAVSADNKMVAWGGATWSVATGERIATIGGWDALDTARLDGTGRLLVGQTRDQIVAYAARTGEKLWAVDTATAIGEPMRRGMASTRLGPRGELLLQGPGFGVVLDSKTGAVLHRLRRDDRAAGFDAIFLATGAVIAVDGARIYVDDLESGERKRMLRGPGHGVSPHPDGARAVLPLRRAMMVLDTRTDTSRTLPFLATKSPKGVAISPDGTLLALVGDSGNIEIYDFETLTWLGRRNAKPADVIGFSAGGRLLAMTAERVMIFDLAVETRPPARVTAEVARLLGE